MMRIGIDLDNTITASKNSIKFFSLLTNLFRGAAVVYIITNRDKNEYSRKDTMNELRDLEIYYDELVNTKNKKDVIVDEEITVYFDDTDEYFLELPDSVTVLKIREDGNFDFSAHKWLYSEKTGINCKDI
jgi:hypothetical protein